MKKKTKVQITDEVFATNFVDVGFNGTKAYQAMKPNTSNKVAGVLGSRKLAKVNVQEKVAEIVKEQGLTEEFLIKALVNDIDMFGERGERRTSELALGADILKLRDKTQINFNLNIASYLDKLDEPND